MPRSSPPTRVVAGRVVPAVGRWTVDPEHAYVGFAAGRLRIATVRARFGEVSGHVDVADDPAESSVELSVATASIQSGSPARDECLRSAEHLDVTRHPRAVFRSTRLRWSQGRTLVTGELTLAGTTNVVELEAVYHGTVLDPWGAPRSVFSGRGVLDREAWGLTWNVTLPGGSLLASSDIRLEIDVETVTASRPEPPARPPSGGARGAPGQDRHGTSTDASTSCGVRR